MQKQPSRDVLKKRCSTICSKFTGEHPCRSVISIKLQSGFIEIALLHGYSPVNLLHILRTPFPKNTPLDGCFWISHMLWTDSMILAILWNHSAETCIMHRFDFTNEAVWFHFLILITTRKKIKILQFQFKVTDHTKVFHIKFSGKVFQMSRRWIFVYIDKEYVFELNMKVLNNHTWI